MGELSLLIDKIKNGEKDKFNLILEKMEPLLKKYVRLLYKDDKEDVRSELMAALWEAVTNIVYFDNDGQVMIYLCRALKNRYFEMYKSSKKQHDYEICSADVYLMEIKYIENQYSDIITSEDTEKFLGKFTGIKKDIYSAIMLEDLSDVQIAKKFSVSRQYINRVRRHLRNILSEIYHI